jgi:hypothetical protein
MPEYLLEGLSQAPLYHATQAMALLAIAVWWEERRGGRYPDGLLPKARTLARNNAKNVLEVQAYLLDLSERTQHAALQQIIRDFFPKGPDAAWRKVVEEARKVAQSTIERARGPLSGILPEEPVYFAGFVNDQPQVLIDTYRPEVGVFRFFEFVKLEAWLRGVEL